MKVALLHDMYLSRKNSAGLEKACLPLDFTPTLPIGTKMSLRDGAKVHVVRIDGAEYLHEIDILFYIIRIVNSDITAFDKYVRSSKKWLKLKAIDKWVALVQ